ncbi:MAG: hypothetical protein CV087_21825 [Candidatus Brocadia sp. WS118]|nr:MAG: hypothetical protein CV087_21825 [Candidatus Brocadia sp. WS118]
MSGSTTEKNKIIYDEIGQKFHDILWHSINTPLERSKRNAELATFVYTIKPVEAFELYKRIHKGYDLHSSFYKRLNNFEIESLKQVFLASFKRDFSLKVSLENFHASLTSNANRGIQDRENIVDSKQTDSQNQLVLELGRFVSENASQSPFTSGLTPSITDNAKAFINQHNRKEGNPFSSISDDDKKKFYFLGQNNPNSLKPLDLELAKVLTHRTKDWILEAVKSYMQGQRTDKEEIYWTLISYAEKLLKEDEEAKKLHVEEALEMELLKQIEKAYEIFEYQEKLRQKRNDPRFIDPRSSPGLVFRLIPQDWETVTDWVNAWRLTLNMALDFVPIVGDIKGIVEGIIGYDMMGHKLELWERGLGAIPLVGKAGKAIKNVTKGSRIIAESLKAVEKVADLAGFVIVAKEKFSNAAFFVAQSMIILRYPRQWRESIKVTSKEMLEVYLRASRIEEKAANQVVRDFEIIKKTRQDLHLQRRLESDLKYMVEPIPISAKKVANENIRTRTSSSEKVNTTASSVSKASRGTSNRGIKEQSSESVSPKIEKTEAKLKETTRSVTKQRKDDAWEILEKMKVKVTRKQISSAGENTIEFIESFHKSPGFHRVIEDWAAGGWKQEGARFVIEYSNAKLKNMSHVEFEVPLPVKKIKTDGTETVGRYIDIRYSDAKTGRMTTFEVEVKNVKDLYSSKVKQLWIDVSSRKGDIQGLKWVFNSKKLNKQWIVDKFTDIIKKNEYLKKVFGDTEKLIRENLDKIIEVFP